jgi:hypothetical protein
MIYILSEQAGEKDCWILDWSSPGCYLCIELCGIGMKVCDIVEMYAAVRVPDTSHEPACGKA